MTKKQKRFADEWLIDLNGTQAAIRAGYSPDTAASIASENLRKPEIEKYIAKAMAERSRRTGVNQDRVVQELAKIAFVKMTDVVDSEGRIKEDAREEDLSCIESIKCKKSDTDGGSSEEREVKVASKLKALELLGKHLGMWNDKLVLYSQWLLASLSVYLLHRNARKALSMLWVQERNMWSVVQPLFSTVSF